MKWYPLPLSMFLLILPANSGLAELAASTGAEKFPVVAVTPGEQRSNVRSTDRSFQAVRSINDRYGCITSNFDDSITPSGRALTRYEFATGLNNCLTRMNELSASSTTVSIRPEDLDILNRLQQEFAPELSIVRERANTLADSANQLNTQQFSPTTKLRGQVIIAVNAGGFTGERIIDAQGRQIANEQPNSTTLYRVALDMNTSFTGTDGLRILLETGSGGGTTNVTGLLEPTFGSVIDFSVKPPTRNTIGIGRLVYAFKPNPDLQVAIGPDIRISDYIDRNRYANLSFRDFNSQIFVNNLLLMTNDGPSAGGAIDWNPDRGAFSFRATYSARDAANSSSQGPIRGGASFVPSIYPVQGGNRGLFGDTHQYTAELEYAPSKAMAVRLQYSGGEVYARRFDVAGINVELQFAPQIAFFGRYGYGSYKNTRYGDINPNYWMAGVAFPDLLMKGSLAGIAIGQPFISTEVGTANQTNIEAFYRISVSDNIQVTPSLQIVNNPSNQSVNGTIVTGTVRTVFSF